MVQSTQKYNLKVQYWANTAIICSAGDYQGNLNEKQKDHAQPSSFKLIVKAILL